MTAMSTELESLDRESLSRWDTLIKSQQRQLECIDVHLITASQTHIDLTRFVLVVSAGRAYVFRDKR
jgi:hypothetical protein